VEKHPGSRATKYGDDFNLRIQLYSPTRSRTKFWKYDKLHMQFSVPENFFNSWFANELLGDSLV
jgi:hypothetical protein